MSIKLRYVEEKSFNHQSNEGLTFSFFCIGMASDQEFMRWDLMVSLIFPMLERFGYVTQFGLSKLVVDFDMLILLISEIETISTEDLMMKVCPSLLIFS